MYAVVLNRSLVLIGHVPFSYLNDAGLNLSPLYTPSKTLNRSVWGGSIVRESKRMTATVPAYEIKLLLYAERIGEAVWDFFPLRNC